MRRQDTAPPQLGERRGRHLRAGAQERAGWRRPALLLWTALTAGCAAALAIVYISLAGPAARQPAAGGIDQAWSRPDVAVTSVPSAPPAPRPTPTTRTLQGSPAVNRIESFSRHPDGLQVQIEEAEWWPAPGSRRLELVKALVRIRNGTGRRFDPKGAVVVLRYGKSRAAATVVEPGHFAGTLTRGADSFAQWLFTLPAGHHDQLEVVVTVAPDRQPLAFRGGADLP